jgi:perosamine synthetase
MKYIPYGRHHIDENDIAEVLKVLRSDWITQGPKVDEFEREICSHTGAKYAVAVSNGTAALHLACLVAGLKKGDEAITTPITFLATPNSILYTGATPVFADIDYETVNIDPDQIKKKITKKTKVVLPVHFAGLPCDMPEILRIARKNRLFVIEDACHALGAEYRHRGKWIKVGSCKHSDMTVFSFHPVKHITTGEGGAVTTNSLRLYKKLKTLRSHGIYKNKKMAGKKGSWYYEMRDLGFNYRITDFQCALGISQLKKLDLLIEKRRKIVAEYERAFKGNNFFDLPFEAGQTKSAWHLYSIKLKDKYACHRKELSKKLRNLGVGTQVHYIPVHTQPFYKSQNKTSKVNFPRAEYYYGKCLSIPLFPSMTKKETKKVIDSISTVFEVKCVTP